MPVPPGSCEDREVKVAFIPVVVAVLVLRGAASHACDCPDPPPTDRAFAAAKVVVVAKVEGVDTDKPPPSTATPIDGGWALSDIVQTGDARTRLTVTRAWKGANA